MLHCSECGYHPDGKHLPWCRTGAARVPAAGAAPARERTIYDLLRALVTVSASDPQFVNQYMDETGRAEWFEVIDKAEKMSVFGEMARHL